MSEKVVITGASSGIGAALAWQYAAKGCDIALCARREDKLQQLCEQLQNQYPHQQFIYECLDVAQLDTVADVFGRLKSRLGQLDIVIANAGITDVRPTGNGQLDKDIRIINTNLLGAIATIDAAVAIFREQKKGHLVGISSFSAFRGIPGSAAYSSSKAALTNYLQAVGTELFTKNIKVTCIHPGFINTDISDNMEKFPFVIEADKAAKAMIKAIAKGKKDVTVPSWPWAILKGVMPKLPDSVISKVF